MVKLDEWIRACKKHEQTGNKFVIRQGPTITFHGQYLTSDATEEKRFDIYNYRELQDLYDALHANWQTIGWVH